MESTRGNRYMNLLSASAELRNPPLLYIRALVAEIAVISAVAGVVVQTLY